MKTEETSFIAGGPAIHRSGSALLITLLILSLITIIAVAFLGAMTWEISAARNSYENQKARAMAMLGMNTAVAQLRQALDTWDNPYYNFATNPPAYYWSVSPGIITRWSYASAMPVTNYPLFSLGSTNLVNLNAVTGNGSYPIAGETNASSASVPNISVYWVNVLKNPAIASPSAANPIVGRYAFWVDDESAKINLNTADGTMKYQTNSLGLGTPSEVSLQALQQQGSEIPVNLATNIVYLARTAGLNSPQEILRAAGATPDLYTNNIFNITSSSRSPDLNIFGQPKMALMPILGDTSLSASDMILNGITLQPPKEIYPTPSQLPPYRLVNPANPTYFQFLNGNGWLPWYPATAAASTPEPWPLAFRSQAGVDSSGNPNCGISCNGALNTYAQTNYMWINGMMLANYLAGTNAANQAIIWPAFPGTASPSTGFSGKYTSRQIDSITAQVLSLGAEDISPDYPYASTVSFGSRADQNLGQRAVTTPLLQFGWLSHQWVNGMGRTPKVDAMELQFTPYGSTGTIGAPGPNQFANYTPPYVTLDIWQEWWLPASYLGGNNVPLTGGNTAKMYFGVSTDPGVLNTGDLSGNTTISVPSPPTYNWPPAPLPRVLPNPANTTNSYWGNQLLTDNQGLDFQGNPSGFNDPDQVAAAQYHPYQYDKNGNGLYAGAGAATTTYLPFAPVFQMNPLQVQYPSQDWAPGEMRCVKNIYGSPVEIDMQTNAGSVSNPTLTIGGGIQVAGYMVDSELTDPDPVPLESIRGYGSPYLYDSELWTNTPPPASIPGSPSGSTVRDRNIASVIPVSFNMPIPASDDGSGAVSSTYVLAKVADPLVAGFPGDWSISSSTAAPTIPSYWLASSSSTTATNNEYTSDFHSLMAANNGDPDSYWMPQADCAVAHLTDIAGETLIPRSARFPNIGYLQYLRTGIIPDDETQSYQSQHGTPFRLLSYAPSTSALNQETTRGSTSTYGAASQPYPDWAMLDLLYVPSTLAPYGGPYGYYQTNGVWQGYGSPGVLASYSTGGGSTPGRINPNGAVIYTTNVSMPQPDVARTVPMQAVVHGLWVNQTLNTANLPSPTPGLSGGTAVDDSLSESDANSIPVAIERYIRANGPLRMPAELCNVPEIAALRPAINATRNDLIRQIVGNLTTQSNTFSVWVAGESISKIKTNTDYAIYEAGDQVLASVRYHFIVERYLDPGADGVYGNAASAGADGIVGTYDDPVDPMNHPFQPRYIYRVVSAEEIR